MKTRNVSYVWIKGHSGIEGNVRANQLAYQALLEFKKCPYNKDIKELLAVEIPAKYIAKRSLLLRFDDTINMAEQAKYDRKIVSLLREKKQGLENAIIKHEDLIRKCNPELKQKQETKGKLPKNKKVKCLYCNKLFKKGSYCNQHIRDKHQNANAETVNGFPEYFVCCYCGIKLLVEKH
jgi:hypothetical protein